MKDESKSPDRLEEILAAAARAFSAFGYRRAAMDDIAREAGMSRSALYLHFRNKEDIFRHLVARYLEKAVAEMEKALARPGQSAEEALVAAFMAKDGDLVETVLGSPHGAELLDVGMNFARDSFAAVEARKIEILTEWLERLPLAPGVGTPESVARAILAASIGLKFPGQTLQGYREGQSQLARLFAKAVTRP